MADFRLTVVPKPKEGTASVLEKPKGGDKEPYIVGEGKNNYLCGNCGHLLIENVHEGQVAGIVFKCPNCGSYNAI